LSSHILNAFWYINISHCRWIQPANLEQMRNLFLKSLRFLSARENQQDAIKSGRFDEVVASKTLDFFTVRADSAWGPRTTLQSQAELQGLQYLEDSDRTLSSLERYPLVRYRPMFRKFHGGLPSSAAVKRFFSYRLWRYDYVLPKGIV